MMKKILLTMVIILILLVVVLVINANRLGNTQVEPGELPMVSVDRDAMLERFSKAITFQTISYEESAPVDTVAFKVFLDFIRDEFPLVHSRFDQTMFNELTPLYFWEGSDSELDPILLMGHYDVVPIDSTDIDGWEFPPFSGTMTDTHIWGRGSLDNKNNVMGLLETAEYLLESGYEPRRSIYFLFGHDEEIGGQKGARAVATYFEEQGIRFHMVMDEGGVVMAENPIMDTPIALVGIAEKGYVSIELVVRTDGGHSSRPPKESAVSILSEAITKINRNQMPARLDGATQNMFDSFADQLPFTTRLVYGNRWLFEGLLMRTLSDDTSTAAMIRTTTAPTMLRAGVKDNVLPTEARAVVNFRILPGDSNETIFEHLKNVIDDDRVEMNNFGSITTPPTPVTPTDTEIFRTLQQTIMDRFGEIVVSPYLVIGATDARHFTGLSENVFRFSPIYLEQDGLSRIHGTGERIDIDSYVGSVSFYSALIVRMTE